MAQIIAVHSFRGGTGKSNLIANIAATMALQGQRVGIIDTDVPSRSQLGSGRRVYSQGLPLAINVEYEDELNNSVLDCVALAGKRFDWMVGRLIII